MQIIRSPGPRNNSLERAMSSSSSPIRCGRQDAQTMEHERAARFAVVSAHSLDSLPVAPDCGSLLRRQAARISRMYSGS